jgi:hypothetical protein
MRIDYNYEKKFHTNSFVAFPNLAYTRRNFVVHPKRFGPAGRLPLSPPCVDFTNIPKGDQVIGTQREPLPTALFASTQRINMSRDNLLLILRAQLAEITAPPPHPHNQVLVPLRVRARIQQNPQVQAVHLKLLAAQLSEGAHQHRRLADALFVAKH